MPWQISISTSLQIIELSFTGIVSADELSAAARESLHLVNSSKLPRVLTDCTKMAPEGHSLFDIYDEVKTISANISVRDIREAILIPEIPRAVEKAAFWETACFNHGLKVRLFSQRDAAMQWLFAP